eukprot:Tbor_TRINITY_DN5222_c0_g3::TRINITY_DN5222_c0_g3_i1::g.16361::m.16361
MTSSPKVEETGQSPCRLESLMWRECLKLYNYGPEKPETACEKERVRYYACQKSWRETLPDAQPVSFTLPPACHAQSNALHNCMMINMFEVAKCQTEMTALRVCVGSCNPEVEAALMDDIISGKCKSGVIIRDKLISDPDDATGWLRVWYKLIGKV